MATTQVILTEAISSLGAEADVVKVRAGYARNFLIPLGKALEATGASLQKINHLKAKRAEREARELIAAEELASKINKLSLTMNLETGIAGKAFGAITAHDLVELLKRELKGHELPKHAIVLDRPIKETGEKTISVVVHPDVTATLRVTIKASSLVEEKEEGEASKKAPRASRAKREKAAE